MSYPTQLFLFGAGASYGSDVHNTPPLGSDLFNALRIFDAEDWGQLPRELANLFQEDFEKGMMFLEDKYPTPLAIQLQKKMAHFLFAFRPSPNNLYCKLAHKIRRASIKNKWRGALVTLNYDPLLELAISQQGLKIIWGSQKSDRQSYDKREIELCLPHGASFLFCDRNDHPDTDISISVPSESIAKLISQDSELPELGTLRKLFPEVLKRVSENPNITIFGANTMLAASGSIISTLDQSKFEDLIWAYHLPPVMSYFEPTKLTLSGIQFIQQQRQRYDDLVMNATTIAIIGVKVRLHDNHIWDPLAKTSAKLVYCSGKEDGAVFSAWCKTKRSGKTMVLPGYFADCFNELSSMIM